MRRDPSALELLGTGVVRFILALPRLLGLVALYRWWQRRSWIPEDEWPYIEPPRCRKCGYDLRSSPQCCPECGTPLDPLDATIVQYLMSVRRGQRRR